jgi:hypothetical protein
MGTHFYCIPLTLAAALMGEFGVSAQDWRMVDDFALPGADAEAHGVAVDAAGRVYVVGTANGHAIVRYSGDGGANWSTRADFVYPPGTNNAAGTNNLFNAITINQQGDLYVGGASAAFVGGVNAGRWIVRRSRDQGISWETVDDYWQPRIGPEQGTNGAVYSLSTDGQGRVYGTGLMLPTGPSYLRWWVRGSDIGGTNWNTKLVLFSGYAGVSQLTWAGEDVYVTGSASDSVTTTGLMLRSSDFGVTWSTNFESTSENYPAITSDRPGNIYAAGNRSSSNSYDWVVRKATPGGTNWTVLDTVPYGDLSQSGNQQANPKSIAVDAAGDVLVAGQLITRWIISATNGTTYGVNQNWFTRQYSVASRQWKTTDVFGYSTNATSSTNTHAIAMATAIALDRSAFVVGYGTTESGQRRWVVRKGSAFMAPPRLQIAVAGEAIAVSWPAAYTNSVLEWTDSPGVNAVWQVCPETVHKVAGQNMVTCEPGSGARFFRLKSSAGQ